MYLFYSHNLNRISSALTWQKKIFHLPNVIQAFVKQFHNSLKDLIDNSLRFSVSLCWPTFTITKATHTVALLNCLLFSFFICFYILLFLFTFGSTETYEYSNTLMNIWNLLFKYSIYYFNRPIWGLVLKNNSP